MKKRMKKVGQLVGAMATIGVAMVGTALLGLAGWGCYPKNCDPKTDPLKCECPDGPCGNYPPSTKADAGSEGGK